MKLRNFFCLIAIVTFQCFAQTGKDWMSGGEVPEFLSTNSKYGTYVGDLFLKPGRTYTVGIDDNLKAALPALAADPVKLDIPGIILHFNTVLEEVVGSSRPIFVYGGHDNTADIVIKYIPLDAGEYGTSEHIPATHWNMYEKNIVSINSNYNSKWHNLGGPSGIAGTVDINTIIRHELGHLFIKHKDGDPVGKSLTLMSEGQVHKYNNSPPLLLGEDERALIARCYKKPTVEILKADGSISTQKTFAIGEEIRFRVTLPNAVPDGTFDHGITSGLQVFTDKWQQLPYDYTKFDYDAGSFKGWSIDQYEKDKTVYTFTWKPQKTSKYTHAYKKIRYTSFVRKKTYVIEDQNTVSKYLNNPDFADLLAGSSPEFEVSPKNKTATDYTPKNRSSAIIVKSKITEFDGVTDYPVNRVEFFVKKENESVYSPIASPVNANGVNPKYYWTEWNGFTTGEGNYSLKSRAFYTVDGHTMTVTDSMELDLPKAFCQIVSPLPDEIVDLHYPKGLGFDLKGEENLAPGSFKPWMAVIGEDGLDYMPHIAGNKEFSKIKPELKSAFPKTATWRVSPFWGSNQQQRQTTWVISGEKARIQNKSARDLYGIDWLPDRFIPGKYKLWCSLANSELTELILPPDTLSFQIPNWSFHYKNTKPDDAGDGVYIPKLHYRRGGIIQLGLWNFSTFKNIVSVDISNESGEIVHSFDLTESDKAFYHEWQTSTDITPGFYKLTGREKDSTGAVVLTQESTIQLTPLYVDFENDGNWPNEWPGTDTPNWKIHTGQWHPNLGYYTMAAWYETKNHTNISALTHSGVNLEPGREYEIIYSLGIKKNEGSNFDPLYANYSLQVNRDGEWLTVKTVDPSEYVNFPWANQSMYCLIQSRFNLGTSTTDPVSIRFVQEGKPEYYTPADQPELNKVQEVLYDNIILAYKKSSGISSPIGLTVTPTGDGKAKLSWQHDSKKADYQVFEKFRIYKNGITVSETVNLEFVDNYVSANSVYSYAITAVYRNRDNQVQTETPVTGCMTNYSSYWTVPFTENFESGSLPGSWKNTKINSSAGLWTVINNQNAGYNAQSGNNMIRYVKSNSALADTVRLETPVLRLSNIQYPMLDFWVKTNLPLKPAGAVLQVQIKAADTDWQDLGLPVDFYGNSWQISTSELVQFLGSDVKIGFKLIVSGAQTVNIDNIRIYDLLGSTISDNLPLKTELFQNYPNPFNPATAIKYSISQAGKVNLSIYNSNGQFVEELVKQELKPGCYSHNFNGEKYNSGLYFYRLQTPDQTMVKKMLLCK